MRGPNGIGLVALASEVDCILSYLTECIDEMVPGSQQPHKIVNLLFTVTS